MDAVRDVARSFYRLVVLWMADVVSLLGTASILPGFALQALLREAGLLTPSP